MASKITTSVRPSPLDHGVARIPKVDAHTREFRNMMAPDALPHNINPIARYWHTARDEPHPAKPRRYDSGQPGWRSVPGVLPCAPGGGIISSHFFFGPNLLCRGGSRLCRTLLSSHLRDDPDEGSSSLCDRRDEEYPIRPGRGDRVFPPRPRQSHSGRVSTIDDPLVR